MNPGRKSKMKVRIRYMMRELARRPSVQVFVRRFSQGYRLLLLISAALVIVLVFPGGSARDFAGLQVPMVAQEDVIAPVTFDVYKSEAEMTEARAEAAAGVVPFFDHSPELADTSLAAAAAFFDSVEAVVSNAGGREEQGAAVRALLDEYRIAASEEQVELLIDSESRGQLESAIESAFQRLLRPGVVRAADLGDVASSAVIVRSADSAGGRLEHGDSLTTMQQFFEDAGSQSPAEVGVDGRRLLHNIAVRFARPTIVLNQEATEAARNQAKQAVNPVKYEVLEGERIVEAHERVGAEQRERLQALRDHLSEQEGARDWPANVGGFLYNLLLLAVLGLVLRYFRPGVYASSRSLTLIWFLVLAVAGAAALISRTDAAWQLIPVAFAALTIATLYDGVLALLAVFVLVALISSGPAFAGIVVPFFTVMGGAAAALSGRVVRRRAHTWTFAAVIAGAYILAAFSLGLMGLQNSEAVIKGVFWGTVNGVGCTLLAMGILPLAESFTKITTDQSLL
ncbi:MAG: hypothetical protein PVJ64_12480, partial [Gemmatimonadales bacterium]